MPVYPNNKPLLVLGIPEMVHYSLSPSLATVCQDGSFLALLMFYHRLYALAVWPADIHPKWPVGWNCTNSRSCMGSPAREAMALPSPPAEVGRWCWWSLGSHLGIFHRSNMEIVPNEMGISMGKSKGIPPMKRRHLSIKPSFGPIMGHISHEPGGLESRAFTSNIL